MVDSGGKQRLLKWLVGVMGVGDLLFKYWSVGPPRLGEAGGNNAVINLGVSGGVMVSEWLIGVGLVGILYWYVKERSLGLWMILVGGVANVASRVVWEGVVDYWSLFGMFSNNLADYLVVGGVIMIVNQSRR